MFRIKIMNQKIISAVALVAFVLGMFSPLTATAASLSSQSDVMSRLKVSTLSDHTIKFVTPTGLTAGQTITVTFPAGFTMGTFNVNNVDLATGASCSSISSERTLAASASGATWGVAQAGQVITLTSGTDTITAGHCVEIQIGSNATSGGSGSTQITNPVTANTYLISIGGTFADSGSMSVAIITDDQVVVTATVDQALSFSISDNSIGFGTLTAGGTRYATGTSGQGTEPTNAHDIAASTNASGGYNITIVGNTLTSGANTISAISGGPTALSTGTEQFGIRTTVASGSGTVASPFNGSSGNYGFSTTPTTPVNFASATGVSTTTYNVNYAANISGSTEAGTYTATLTYVATATF